MLKKLLSLKNRNHIARIEISGAIDGRTRTRVLKAIKQVGEENYPILVVRIDSPGGTVVDSHEIYQALLDLKEKDTRVLASFGNIAASGGVYIAMGAEQIMSNPGTITGSVGVILRGNNLERLLDKIGVSFKVIKSGPYKDILSFDRELTPSEQQILQSLIDSTYSQFVQTIVKARNLTLAAVHDFADGRIFSGEQAKEVGLVDRLGTEEDARKWAAELADLDVDQAKFVDFGKQKKMGLLGRILPGQQQLLQRAEFELMTSGLPLWMYWP